jgi:hypothetical protein
MHDTLITLSAKLTASFVGALLSFMSTPLLAAIDTVPSWFSEYGALGMMCSFLIYALKIMHGINQQLQKDWREDRRQSEVERLADRDRFYGKIESLFKESAESRERLVKSFENLSDSIDASCRKQSEGLDSLERTIKNQPPHHIS